MDILLKAIPIAIPVILVILIFLMGYVKAPPDVAYIISGLRKHPKVLIGKAGIKIPFLERVDKLIVRQISIDIKSEGYIPTQDFIGVDVDAVAKVRVMTDPARAASWRPVRPASSRNPDDANDARRHLGRNHDDVCHSGEHRSMPLRGRTRTSSTGSGRRGESTIRTVSTTTPLTLRSWLNMLFIRRFAVVCLSWSKTSYPESALHLLPQRLNDEPPPTKTAIAPYSTYR